MISKVNDSAYYLTIGMEVLLGDSAIEKWINPVTARDGASDHFLSFESNMELTTEPQCLKGLVLEAGRIAFDNLLKDAGEEIGIQSTSFRMLPTRSRLEKGLRLMAEWFQTCWNWQCSVEEAEDHWTWIFNPGSENLDQKANEARIDFLQGLIQGFLTWAGGGKYYSVVQLKEKETCSYKIKKTPLD